MGVPHQSTWCRRSFIGHVARPLSSVVVGSTVVSNGDRILAQMFPILCSWAGASRVGAGLAPGAQQAVYEVQSILAAIQFYAPVEVLIGGVPNAAATVINGYPAIVYNPQFLRHLAACDPVAAQVVLAHEVGHHANRDTTWSGQFRHPWQRELGADWVAGLAMRRLGIPLRRALNSILCSMGPFSPGSPSHPDSQRRLTAVREGWLYG